MKGYTFIDYAKDVLKLNPQTPMKSSEIWDKGKELGFVEKLGSKGLTPYNSFSTILSQRGDENGIKSMFENPKYYLLEKEFFSLSQEDIMKKIQKKEDNIEKETKSKEQNNNKLEAKLHPLLVRFVSENQHFLCKTKTIQASPSKKEKKGEGEWLHPDLIGVRIPQFTKEIKELQKELYVNKIKFFSFEMKVKLQWNNYKQFYFQAASNSSWANEGYLVALQIEEDSEFIAELNRLAEAFGIGIILLNIENVVEIFCYFVHFHEIFLFYVINFFHFVNLFIIYV